MGRLAIHPITGEIALGATGPGGPGAAQHVRILGLDGSLTAIGAPVPDPDAVVWDTEGLVGPADSVLVAGVGGLYAVTTGGSTERLMPAGEGFFNPEALAFDLDGGLLMADYNTHRVQRLDPDGSFSTVINTSDPVNQIALSSVHGLVAGDQRGTALIPGSASGEGFYTGIAFGDGSSRWGDDLWAVDRSTGSLVRFGADGPAVLATGLFDGIAPDINDRAPDAQIGFLPTGEMILALPATGEVFAVIPAPASLALLGAGALLTIKRRR
jgi:LPXTG-motif cell wall-anchored protein